ncbi:MAG: Smr/MutS family protein [Bacilli bacterium]|nr:Smr/MutS family protein [Bacilli bacterium]MDD4808987.1 Smr/MutS family protein [Bacilli bacterium]
MSLNRIVFLNSYPKLDLHGYDRDSARLAIIDFIRDNKIQKNEILVIVHGRGSGILKKMTTQTVKNHKDVIDYKSFYYNDGCTVIQIKC